MHKRRQLYKSPLLVSPPPWKDVYRKKCFERLRARRASLIEKFRFAESPSKMILESTSPAKIVSDVMEIEWNAINHNRSFPSLSIASPSSVGSMGGAEFEENQMRETLREIQNELQGEDEARLNEFLQFDSSELESKVDMFLSEEVICPICQKGKLKESTCNGVSAPTPTPSPFQTPPRTTAPRSVTVVRCDCGVLLSGAGFNCTLNRIRSALKHNLYDHEKSCPSTLVFTPMEDNAGTNILVTCSSCEWMTFLL